MGAGRWWPSDAWPGAARRKREVAAGGAERDVEAGAARPKRGVEAGAACRLRDVKAGVAGWAHDMAPSAGRQQRDVSLGPAPPPMTRAALAADGDALPCRCPRSLLSLQQGVPAALAEAGEWTPQGGASREPAELLPGTGRRAFPIGVIREREGLIFLVYAL